MVKEYLLAKIQQKPLPVKDFARFRLLLETRCLHLPFNNSIDQLLNCGARLSQDCRLLLRCFQRRLLLVGGRLRWCLCVVYPREPPTVRACRRHAILIPPHKAAASVWGRGTVRGTACRRHATFTVHNSHIPHRKNVAFPAIFVFQKMLLLQPYLLK